MNDNAQKEITKSIVENLIEIQNLVDIMDDGSPIATFWMGNIVAKLHEVGMWTRSFTERMLSLKKAP